MNIWQYLEIAGVAVGILYLYFEYKASVWLWLTGIVMPAIYIFVYYESGFYADMGINIYYLFAGFYGWAAWLGRSRKKNGISGAMTPLDTAFALESAADTAAADSNAYVLESVSGFQPYMAGATEIASSNEALSATAADITTSAAMPITRMPARFWMPLALIVLVFFVVISYVLINFTDSTVPLGDSFTTALSVVGLWMLARKYVDQWLVWIVVDVICSGLYLYKGLYLTGLLFALYSVVAVFGYFKWLKLMKG